MGNQRSVKVMSYNIHHGEGTDKVLDLRRIAAVIKQSGAEIVGLQEVDNQFSRRSLFEDQAARLAELTGMQVAFAPNVSLGLPIKGARPRQYGNAVLSSFPIRKAVNHPLISFGLEKRGLFETVIDVKGGLIRFYTTHLGLTARQRKVQVKSIKSIVEGADGTKLLAGDLNARPDSPEIASLLETFQDSFTGRKADYTFPATKPFWRIDYILHSADAIAGNREVIASQASDHLPITAEFNILRTK